MKRVITALVLIPLVVYIVLYTAPFWIFVAVSIINLLALAEYNSLNVLKARERWTDLPGVVPGLLVPPAVYWLGIEYSLVLLVGAVFLLFVANMAAGREMEEALIDIGAKTLGIAYVAVPLSYLILIRGLASGELWILFLLVVIWANDTFAYAVGKGAGRHKLSPEISPNKTVEGAIGGLLGGIGVAYAFNRYIGLGMETVEWAAISAAIGVVGLLGDLSESLIKRAVGVKDSSAMIPGHGGILDRIDSLIFSIPLLYYILIWR